MKEIPDIARSGILIDPANPQPEVRKNAEMARGGVVELTQDKLPMADSIILAIARTYPAELWMQDMHYNYIEVKRFVDKRP